MKKTQPTAPYTVATVEGYFVLKAKGATLKEALKAYEKKLNKYLVNEIGTDPVPIRRKQDVFTQLAESGCDAADGLVSNDPAEIRAFMKRNKA